MVPKLSTSRPLYSESQTDKVSEKILKMFDPASLYDKTPVETFGDGNCLYRALSLALTGSQDFHICIRLLTSLEILQYRHHYDANCRGYVDRINNVRESRYTSPSPQVNVTRSRSPSPLGAVNGKHFFPKF